MTLNSMFGAAVSALCVFACSGTENPGSANSSGGYISVGGAATGGSPSAGGVENVGGTSQGLQTGGSVGVGGQTPATGGKAPTGGAKATGGSIAATGGAKATGGSVAATGGANVGGGTNGPCDIYAAASPATPCVAAYSMTRIMYSKYSGALYQVRKGGSWSASAGMTGGTFQDINAVGGYADSATQDTFCSGGTCTVSILYDQSGKGNNLKVAPKGTYSGTASEPDSEGSATKKTFNINGHKVYALYMVAHDGMRNNSCTGIPTGNTDQGVYVVADGTHAGAACCWDFGNVWPDNGNSHTMNPIFFGTGYWGKGAGAGPWFMGDFEGGVWAGGSGASTVVNSSNPSMKVEFAFGILKTSSGQYAIKAANAQSGTMTTAYDGASPKTWTNGGAVVLGTGGDNSNSSFGTFYEGAMTSGRPSNATDDAVLANVQAAKYGQ
jgi:non-reducing end alpha-L-arabinofuranosidase